MSQSRLTGYSMNVNALGSCPIMPQGMSSVINGLLAKVIGSDLLHPQGATAFWEPFSEDLEGLATWPPPQKYCKGVWMRATSLEGACSAPAWLPLMPEPDGYAPPLQSAFGDLQGAELEGALEQTGVIGRVSFFWLL